MGPREMKKIVDIIFPHKQVKHIVTSRYFNPQIENLLDSRWVKYYNYSRIRVGLPIEEPSLL